MALLTRDDLLAKQELVVKLVEFDDGSHVFVKEMSARDRDRWEQSLMVPVKNEKGRVVEYERSIDDFRAKLAVRTVCNEEGVLLLKSDDWSTFSENCGAARMEQIINKAQTLNKISDQDRDNIVKNLEGGPAADSNSDSVES